MVNGVGIDANIIALKDVVVIQIDTSWADFSPQCTANWRRHTHHLIDTSAEVMTRSDFRVRISELEVKAVRISETNFA